MYTLERIATEHLYGSQSRFKFEPYKFIVSVIFNDSDYLFFSSSEKNPIPVDSYFREEISCIFSGGNDFYIHPDMACASVEGNIAVNMGNPVYTLIRKHPECSFLISALHDEIFPSSIKLHAYEKTKSKLEKLVIFFLDEIADYLIEWKKFSFVLSRKIIRDAVICQGFEKSIQLSPKEQECLWIATHGMKIKEIAKLMKISPNTVKTYLNNIKHIFGGLPLEAIVIESIYRGILGNMSFIKPKQVIQQQMQ